MRIMVTGGAGYIGSHMVQMLTSRGHHVVILDNLSSGHEDSVPTDRLYVGDIRRDSDLGRLFSRHKFDAVIHFAARIEVAESLSRPDLYYGVNVCGTRTLLDAMHDAGVKHLVYSSSAAVYGEPRAAPVAEDHPVNPTTPYGMSKWVAERMLLDDAAAGRLNAISLRYFNAAGAAADTSLGERHEPETHLIPLACRAALQRVPGVTVFGRDYPTADGTCIRDYVHVEDLCRAHLLALEYLIRGGNSTTLNLGSGSGYSVQEVIDTVETVSGRRVPQNAGQRRPGDPSHLIASPYKAHEVLGWRPLRSDLATIIGDAWRWEAQRAAKLYTWD